MFKSFHKVSLLVILFVFAFSVSNIAQILVEHNTSSGPVPNLVKHDKYPDFTVTGNIEAYMAFGYASIALSSLSLPIPAGTPITPLVAYTFPGGTFAASMTKGGDGNYYIITIEPALYLFDPSTGVMTLIGSITGMAGDQPNGLKYNVANSTYYMVSSNNFYSLDISSRVATLVGPLNNTGGLMVDLCFDIAGNCYAYDLGLDNAYTINIATGNATLLGSLGYDANYGQGMDYDRETGTIYLSAFNNTTVTGQLRTMDPATGLTTLVVDWGFEQIAPFALNNFIVVPCPVGSATNPNPVDGAIDVSLNPGDLTWVNGAGTTNIEVFFGPSGNVVSVYSGAPVTSYTVPGPLDYFTTYQWRVLDKNDTCSANASTWSFTTLRDPNLNCWTDDFTAGLGNWTITNDGGTCVWEIHQASEYTLPATASGNVMAADVDFCGSGTTLLSTATITAPFDFSIHQFAYIEFDNDWQALSAADFSYVEVSTDGTNWTTVRTFDGTDVRNTHEVVDITSIAALQPIVYVRLRTIQPDWDWWWAVDNFTVCASDLVPVELTSFAAATDNRNVTLNWSTATELNNSGFQVERSNGSEYQSVGFIAGHGTTTEIQNYSYVDQDVVAGKYSYRLKQIDFNGTFEYSNVVEVEVLGIKEFTLAQNYPNPFNPSTTINFSLALDSKVSLKIFNVLGQEVATLVNGQLAAGSQKVSFDASSLNSGVYFYRIDANGVDGQKFSSVKKMILTK